MPCRANAVQTIWLALMNEIDARQVAVGVALDQRRAPPLETKAEDCLRSVSDPRRSSAECSAGVASTPATPEECQQLPRLRDVS